MSMLLQYMREEFPAVPIAPIARKYWNESGGQFLHRIYSPSADHRLVGIDLILQLGVDDEERPATLVAVSQK